MGKKFYLTSIGGIILSILLTVISISVMFIVFIFITEVETLEIILAIFFSIFSSFGLFLCFWNSIIIDIKNKVIIVKTFKIKKFAIEDIKDIYVTTENSLNQKKYCNIVFNLKDNNQNYYISGYLSLFKNKDVNKTIHIVNEINLRIKEIQNYL